MGKDATSQQIARDRVSVLFEDLPNSERNAKEAMTKRFRMIKYNRKDFQAKLKYVPFPMAYVYYTYDADINSLSQYLSYFKILMQARSTLGGYSV